MRKLLSITILSAFLLNSLGPVPIAQANDLRLPAPGVMVPLSPSLNPPILKGIKIHPDDPFRFEFILDQGDPISKKGQLKTEAARLIKYFLATLTIPDKDLWVNLSPYEKDRIIPPNFGLTEMGRDLLAEDYMLKQITASLIYPEDGVGKRFWRRIYEEAAKKYGTTNIPVNTFNKVWIVPAKAVVYENVQAATAYVVDSKLKVMLEQDYLSLEKHAAITTNENINALGSKITREIVIPELTREVNEGSNFSQLRQVYNSLILATWYKKKIKDSILGQVYTQKNKIIGMEYHSSVIPASYNKNDVEAIYQRYLQAFKKGVYNYIKEDTDPITQETIPRKYFSGGARFDNVTLGPVYKDTRNDAAILSSQPKLQQPKIIEVGLNADQAMPSPDDNPQIRMSLFGHSFKPEDLPDAKNAVDQMIDYVNDISAQRAGPFTIQQYIPVNLRTREGEELPADVHGGRGQWFVIKKLLQSRAFQNHYGAIPGLSPEGQFEREDIDKMIDKFIEKGLIDNDKGEGQELRDLMEEFYKLLPPREMRSHASMNGKISFLDYTKIVYFFAEEDRQKAEEFYGRYYELTRRVNKILSRVQGKIVDEAFPVQFQVDKEFTDGFVLQDLEQGYYVDRMGQQHLKMPNEGPPVKVIDFSGVDLEKLLTDKPELMVQVFQWAAENDAVISDNVLSMIYRLVREKKEVNEPMKRAFLNLLRSPSKISLVLLQMLDVGLLQRFIPEFEEQMYHFEVPFHRLSVPMHTLHLLYMIEYKLEGDIRFKEASAAYQEILKSDDAGNLLEALRFGIFLHDSFKNLRENWGIPHTLGGAQRTPLILNQFSISSDIVRKVQWLVHNHQNFGIKSANTDENLPFLYSDAVDFLNEGNGILDAPLLDLFYLITVADGSSVDPLDNWYVGSRNHDVSTGLFMAIRSYLNESVPVQKQRQLIEWEDRAAKEKEDIRKNVIGMLKDIFIKDKALVKRQLNKFEPFTPPDVMDKLLKSIDDDSIVADEDVLNEYVKMFPPFYFRTIPKKTRNESLASQFILYNILRLSQFNGLEVQTLVSSTNTQHGPMFELLIGLSKDQKGVMLMVSAVFSAMGFSVLNGEFNTTPKGVVFDRINGYFSSPPSLKNIWNEVKALLQLKVNEIADQLTKIEEQGQRDVLEKRKSKLESFMRIKDTDMSWGVLLPLLINLLIKDLISLEDLFSLNGVNKEFKRTLTGPQPLTRVEFDKEDKVIKGTEKTASTFEVNTPDREIGLMFIISFILSKRFDLNIEETAINTYQQGAGNIFKVSKNGKHLTDKEKKAVKEFLEAFLNVEVIHFEDLQRLTEVLSDFQKDTPKGWVASLGIPFGDRFERAVWLARQLLKSDEPWEEKYSKHEIAVMEPKGQGYKNLKLLSLPKFVELVNPAMFSQEVGPGKVMARDTGGIDLTSNKFLQTQRSSEGIRFHLNHAQLARFQDTASFTSVIINISPLNSLQQFLGINTTKNLHV